MNTVTKKNKIIAPTKKTVKSNQFTKAKSLATANYFQFVFLKNQFVLLC